LHAPEPDARARAQRDTVAFLDDDDDFGQPRGRGPARSRRPPADPERQIMLRRLVAVGVGLLIVILLVLGVRGCLNARETRSFENYVADLTALTADSNSLSKSFFGRLEDPGSLTPLQFEAEVKADRGAAEGLFDRARSLSAPDQLSEAQSLVVLTFQLRRDALAVISDEISTAFARVGSDQADAAIAAQMKTLLASDVLYGRAQTIIEQTLKQQGINATVPSSVFLPSLSWLSVDTIKQALGQVAGTEAATPGVHGLGLIQTTLLPDGTTLQEGSPATGTAAGAELEVQVQNQGESEETGVSVSYSIEGGGSGQGTIDRIAPQETASVKIPIDPAPAAGDSDTITVKVEPVPGEQVTKNNEATYQVTFN
jgi:hypothetical protein